MGTCLKVLQLGRASPAWLAYAQHVTAIVTKGLSDCALTSLSYLRSLVSSSILSAKSSTYTELSGATLHGRAHRALRREPGSFLPLSVFLSLPVFAARAWRVFIADRSVML